MAGSRTAYLVEVVREPSTDGGLTYVARHPELPGCMAHGETQDEAQTNLEEARELYLAELRRRGIPIPEPEGRARLVTWQTLEATAAPDHQAVVAPSFSTGSRDIVTVRP